MRRIHFFVLASLLAMPVAAENLFELYGKAQEAWSKKDFQAALKIAEQLVEVAPEHSGTQFFYARALAANQKEEEAIKRLQKVARMGGSPPLKGDDAFEKLQERKDFQSIAVILERNGKESGRSKVAYRVPGKDLIAEGIAYDPVDDVFYIGSTYRRKILRVDAQGTVTEFAKEKQDGLWGLVGMEVDPARRFLWANTANGGGSANMFMIDPDPSTEGKTALLQYDLRSGKLIRKYEAGGTENRRFFNDVAIASSGDVYISESTAGEIYRVRLGQDKLELLLPGGVMSFPNGLAVSKDDKFLYISHVAGITVVDLLSGQHKLLAGPEDSQLGAHDGLVYYRNSLVGIQILTGGVNRVVRFHLKGPYEVERIEVLQVNHPLFELPTTGDMKGDEFYYIANSQLRKFNDKGEIFPADQLNDLIILKADLLESEKEELREVHEKENQAHLKTDVQMLLENSPEKFLTVSAGKIQRVTREDERKMFEGYFQGAVYTEYADVEPPVIYVSEDGKSGWVITRTRVKRTAQDKKQEFVYAGIMTYEKKGNQWIRVSNVSTFE